MLGINACAWVDEGAGRPWLFCRGSCGPWVSRGCYFEAARECRCRSAAVGFEWSVVLEVLVLASDLLRVTGCTSPLALEEGLKEVMMEDRAIAMLGLESLEWPICAFVTRKSAVTMRTYAGHFSVTST